MADWYIRLIRRLCEQAAIADWLAIADTQQIDVNGFTVALFPDTGPSNTMVLYVELTRYASESDPSLLRHLLESNIGTACSHGMFGLIPGRGTVAYRTVLEHADRISSEELMATMVDLVAIATSQFHSVMARHVDCQRDTAPRSRASPLQKAFSDAK